MKGPPAVRPKFETLNETLAAAAQSRVSLFFVNPREQEQEVPMSRIRERALAVAADLIARGVVRGERVALVLPTSPAFVECFFGVLLAGAVPVPLYPPVRLGRLDEYHRKTAAMLQAVGATLVITDDRIRRFLGVAVQASAPRLGCLTAESLGGQGAGEVKVDPSDLALIQFSSGTTHDPKPVALTHANLLANIAAIDRYINLEGSPNVVGVTWLPLYHDMGLIGNLLEAFYRPDRLVLLPPEMFLAMPAAWLRAISRHRGTITAAPNFAFGLCLKRIRDEELAGVDLSSWSLSLNGAEAVSPAVQRRFHERFAPWGLRETSMTPVYGLSEASLAVTFKPSGQMYRVLGVDGDRLASEGVVEAGEKDFVSVGQPLAGVEVEIRDEHGSEAPAGRVGRIYIRGPSVMSGYFGRPDATEEAIRDGWLDSGDLGFEQGGELFICGRHKDIVIVRGANHAPQEFEAALDGLSGVRAGCAVAVGFVPPGEDDEALAMLVETEEGAPESLVDDVAARVEEHTRIRPVRVELLAPGTLPRTSSGKLRRREAREQWLAGKLSPPKRVTALGLVVEAAKGELQHARAAIERHAIGQKS